MFYVIAVILIICWQFAFMGLSAVSIIHIFLIIAIIIIILRVIQFRKPA